MLGLPTAMSIIQGGGAWIATFYQQFWSTLWLASIYSIQDVSDVQVSDPEVQNLFTEVRIVVFVFVFVLVLSLVLVFVLVFVFVFAFICL